MLKASLEPPMMPPGISSPAELQGHWWVAHTKSRFEKALARDLLDQGIGYYLPLVTRVRIVGRKKRRVRQPLFASYVFICGDENSRAAAMETDRICATLPVADQEQLMSELAGIEKALAGGAELDPGHTFQAGRRCRVSAGPFQGIEGVAVRQEGRTRIMLEISTLGVGAGLEIEADLLEPLPATAGEIE